jgi:hypothetical protein
MVGATIATSEDKLCEIIEAHLDALELLWAQSA